MDPALRVFLLLDALPQGLVWLLALGVLGLLAWRRFRWPRAPSRPAAGKEQAKEVGAEELVGTLRRARFSPWARRHLRSRLARLAVALRCEREGVSPAEAWADLHQGRWPPDPRVRAFLRGEDAQNFFEDLAHALEALERYALGGGW